MKYFAILVVGRDDPVILRARCVQDTGVRVVVRADQDEIVASFDNRNVVGWYRTTKGMFDGVHFDPDKV